MSTKKVSASGTPWAPAARNHSGPLLVIRANPSANEQHRRQVGHAAGTARGGRYSRGVASSTVTRRYLRGFRSRPELRSGPITRKPERLGRRAALCGDGAAARQSFYRRAAGLSVELAERQRAGVSAGHGERQRVAHRREEWTSCAGPCNLDFARKWNLFAECKA